MGSIEDMSTEEMKAQYEPNVFGVFRVTKAVLPHMRKQHGGSIINISSLAGHIALPLYSAYVSTKFAIEGLSESMAYELEPFGIKVVIIEPGAIKTNFRREQAAKGSSEDSPYSSMIKSSSKAIEKILKYRLYPEEVAKTVIQAIENPKPKLRYIVGKDAEELVELRRKSSDEEFFRMIEQNIAKTEEQEIPFRQNRDQVAAAQEEFRITKVVVDGERTAI
jgi:NAD(P)-dependent dehydrogenase (short-subunit alcohol dehydrogenase family)